MGGRVRPSVHISAHPKNQFFGKNMSFTDEQKAAIAEIVTTSLKASTDKSGQEADKKGSGDGKDIKSISQQIKDELESAKAKSLLEESKDAVKNEKEKESSLNQIQESIKFNISIADFAEKNKSLLPEEAGKILAAVAGKTFKDDNEKANTLRKTFLDSFLERQENLENMTGSMKARAEAFKALAESDKERKSNEFWDLVEIGVALKAGARKAEALKKINGGSAGDGSGNPLEAKILAAAEKKFNQTK